LEDIMSVSIVIVITLIVIIVLEHVQCILSRLLIFIILFLTKYIVVAVIVS